MGRKKFTKENSQKFHLLHRSSTDVAHLSDEQPSPLVLVPADATLNERKRAAKRGDGDSISMYSERMGSVASARSRKIRDHVNELGFANDGYDYSKHFGDADGGVIYGANALSQTLLRAKHMELPEEVFAQGDLDPQVLQHAITISEECMDEDLRAALFEDADEEGAFEELDDDFVTQAMAEPTVEDFDFEAHMAKLLNKSAAAMGLSGAKKGPALGVVDEEDEDGEFFDEDDMSWATDEDDEGPGGDADGGRRYRGAQAIDEAQFEQVLREYEEDDEDYDDEADGYDEDGDGDGDEAAIDVMAAGEEARQGRRGLFEAALDEFIQEQKEGEMVAPLPPVDKSFAALEAAAAQLTPLTDEQIRAAAAEQAQLQAAWAEDIRQLEDLARESEQAIPVCQEYLREEKPREAWDCESVLSTLSTTDNLPTVLADNRRYLSRKQLQRGGASSAQSVVSHQSQQSRRLQRAAAPPPVNVAQLLTQRPAPLTGKIVLSGRLNLPAGFTPRDLRLASSGASSGAQSAQMHSILSDAAQATTKATKATGLRAVAEATHEDAASDEGVEDEEDEEEDSDASGDEDVASNVRRRGRETAEERRARKAAVKEARRHKRASKKQLKESFGQEQAKLVKTLGRESAAIEHVSVFRYSA